MRLTEEFAVSLFAVSASSWEPRVLDASAYGPSCVQPAGFDPPITVMSEDCLFLNVFAPANVSSPLPVMVWLHGGGWENGGGNESRLNGTWAVALTAAHLVVTLNYRLNVFGFLGGDLLRNRTASGVDACLPACH
jgi:para-nitrobenzyl esterase